MSPGALLSFFSISSALITNEYFFLNLWFGISIYLQGEGLNQRCVCLKSPWQALIHFFKSTWKRNSLLPQRYEVPGLIVTSTDVWQVSACDWEMCREPLYPHPFWHFRTQIGSVEGWAWFLFLFLKMNPEHVFWGECWRNVIQACLLKEQFCSLTASEMTADVGHCHRLPQANKSGEPEDHQDWGLYFNFAQLLEKITLAH